MPLLGARGRGDQSAAAGRTSRPGSFVLSDLGQSFERWRHDESLLTRDNPDDDGLIEGAVPRRGEGGGSRDFARQSVLPTKAYEGGDGDAEVATGPRGQLCLRLGMTATQASVGPIEH